MSNVKVENLSKNKVKLTIEVTAEQFEVALDKAFHKVNQNVQIQGFRKGKAPKNIFINRYGWESLYQDALDFALNDTYYVALQENNVNPVSNPEIDLDFASLSRGSGFTYKAVVEIWPEAVLGEYKGLKVKAKSTKVTKKMIDEHIANQLKAKSEIIVKEGPAALGDTVVIDFEGFVDGVAFEGGKAENYSLELGSHSFIEGFEDQLVGVSAGTDLDVNVIFPENYAPQLASKPATFKVKVHEVKGKLDPELTDEVVQDMEIDGVNTVAEYTNHVKDLLTKQKEQENENYIMDTLMKKIEKASDIVVPQVVIDENVEKQVEKVEAQAKQYGVPAEIILRYSGFENMDAYKKGAAEHIKRQITEEIIIEEIIKAENFEVTLEEVEAEYKKLANVVEANTEEEAAKKVKDVKKHYPQHQVEHHLKMVKAVNLIKESANIE